ncbi:hypothetical protein BJY04DRAFT_23712 [Aspergillus karnatakaensis]|uniref:uncharacterized protein n=1 Tax=Aspergillus karnatakaensis TaxID=1810916 RepID=UPI003CCCC682
MNHLDKPPTLCNSNDPGVIFFPLYPLRRTVSLPTKATIHDPPRATILIQSEITDSKPAPGRRIHSLEDKNVSPRVIGIAMTTQSHVWTVGYPSSFTSPYRTQPYGRPAPESCLLTPRYILRRVYLRLIAAWPRANGQRPVAVAVTWEVRLRIIPHPVSEVSGIPASMCLMKAKPETYHRYAIGTTLLSSCTQHALKYNLIIQFHPVSARCRHGLSTGPGDGRTVSETPT